MRPRARVSRSAPEYQAIFNDDRDTDSTGQFYGSNATLVAFFEHATVYEYRPLAAP